MIAAIILKCEKITMYKLGRFLQLAGMIILPVAIAGNATDSLSLGQMLTLSAVGIGVFSAGWLLQERGKP